MLELWGMQSNALLRSLPSSLWLGLVALDKGPIYRSNSTKLRTYAKLNCLKFNSALNDLKRVHTS